MGLSCTLIYTSELILCFTIFVWNTVSVKSLFRYCDNEVGREKVHVAEKLYLKFRTFCNYYLIIR